MYVRWLETTGRFTSTPRTVPRHVARHFVSRETRASRALPVRGDLC